MHRNILRTEKTDLACTMNDSNIWSAVIFWLPEEKENDPARIRTWNPLIRSQMHYPMGHGPHLFHLILFLSTELMLTRSVTKERVALCSFAESSQTKFNNSFLNRLMHRNILRTEKTDLACTMNDSNIWSAVTFWLPEEKKTTPPGFEPGIPWFGVRCLIHWATGPHFCFI